MTTQTKAALPPLIGLTQEELQNVALQGKMPRFVGRQIAEWLYNKRVKSFDEMTNISKRNREWLAANYTIGLEAPVQRRKSIDGTVKYLFPTSTGRTVESVYIPDHERATLCVSSQAGCRMNCYFCATGRNGFKGQLAASDILNQILSIPEEASERGEGGLTNVVFMGMGEPLDNPDAVLRVIEILTAPWGLAWSPKRITVSTVGKLPELETLLDRTQVHVAISVHSADPAQRASMMPAQRAYPIHEVMRAMRAYDFTHQRRLSLEYIMWRNVNDDLAHADLLLRLIGDVKCRVNLIRFHAIEGVDLRPSTDDKMAIFRNYLNSKGVTATIRASRGEDIEAACGQLAGKHGATRPLGDSAKKY